MHIALFDSDTLQIHVQKNSLHANWTKDDPHYDQFWQAYLVYIIYKKKPSFEGLIRPVYDTAVRLAERIGNSSPDTVRGYVRAMCAEPNLMLANFTLYVEDESKIQRNLLRAAIINNQHAIVEQILQNPTTASSVLDVVTDIWLPPLQLAGMNGNLDILKTLFATQRFVSMAEMRESAIEGAVSTGQLEVVKFICDPQWGPMNFVR